ncbi:CDP-glycerol glycerophosphotransferase family protein [Actinobacillus vicugnae]|uniref:CDP-glycerol glycerophosphotransferase family protein n=1 Tax=Actinobacillus vicugnae TaxID=2573093 RepID=UPI0012413D76|nr:CDP-glycerol glycerophosphotransferase family protein [Actinobacillus vicugnae]
MKNFKGKLKKALNDPIWAFKRSISLTKEYYHSQNLKYRKYIPLKYEGKFKYTVVSAVYNVEKYLDEYFESLVNQTLNFEKHIYLILVDDGSSDSSAQIIQKWQAKYPNNITYLYKENGGISSARNFGMKHVQTEWVTFIDSDDFVSPNYFQRVDEELSKDHSLEMVVGNLYYYHDKTKVASDTHPLKYRFKDNVTKISVTDMDNYINLFVTVTFFKTQHLKNSGIEFDSKIKPHFEDGKYLADYLLYVYKGKIAYIKNAIFYYRKRGDGNSTIDTAWLKKEKFFDLLKYGYLALLNEHKAKLGFIPKNIQWTVLMDLSWHIKELYNNPGRMDLAKLSEEERERYFSLMKECFSFIDSQHIKAFNMIGIWEMHRTGILGLKGEKPDSYTAFIENIDIAKKQILVCYFTAQDILIQFNLNGSDTIPQFVKSKMNTVGYMPFVVEKRCWVPYKDESEILSVNIDNKLANLSIWNKHYKQISIGDILKKFHQPSKKYASDDSWILIDRDVQADDNAEHLYRYIKDKHPEQKCYFALNRNSHDWDRLSRDNFNLLEFGSDDFEKHLRKASKIISSHFDSYIQNYFQDEYDHSKKFVFLQHGVTKDDMSNILLYKRNMLCMLTSTLAEYESIIREGSGYQIGKKETVLTGFPRHDFLLKSKIPEHKQILIMPTWRHYIVGEAKENSNTREINPLFMETDYAKYWSSLIKSERLAELSQRYGYKIVFAPHKNIEPYLQQFNIPEYINIWSASESKISIQQLFQNSQLMITDYSSVAFEMGFLGKMVLYYHFDQDKIFSGNHIAQKGYFSYELDGFGPVATTEMDLLDNLEQLLLNNGKATEPYLSRMEQTFPFRDGNNCERVWQAIKNLDVYDDSIDLDILEQYTNLAYTNKAWSLFNERSNKLLELGNQRQKQFVIEKKLNALHEQLKDLINNCGINKSCLNSMDINEQQRKLFSLLNEVVG